ncbi:hypothetical protein L1887_27575 [Cichorium endivia]|nr:hypothetical protein L1887_27575 [Cichorium endivia]
MVAGNFVECSSQKSTHPGLDLIIVCTVSSWVCDLFSPINTQAGVPISTTTSGGEMNGDLETTRERERGVMDRSKIQKRNTAFATTNRSLSATTKRRR